MLRVTLDGAELLVLLDAMRAEQMPGLRLDLPPDPAARHELILAGQARLRARGLASDGPDGSLVLDEALVLLGAVATYPTLLCVASLQDAAGSQVSAYAHCDGLMVTQRIADGQVELLSGVGVGGLLADLRQRLPPTLAGEVAPATLLVAPKALDAAVARCAAGDDDAAAILEPFGADPTPARLLLAALARPLLAGSLALVRFAQGEQTTSRQLSFVVDEHCAWWIAPALAGAAALRAERMGGRRLLATVAAQLRRLGIAPRTA